MNENRSIATGLVGLPGRSVAVQLPAELVEGPGGDPLGVSASHTLMAEVLAVVITEVEAVEVGLDPYSPPPGVRVVGDGGATWTGGDVD